jgi:hypothetical protein
MGEAGERALAAFAPRPVSLFGEPTIAAGARVVLAVAAVHLGLALALALLLLVPAEPLLGVHPALKPLKFALSIGTYLVTMAFVLPRLTLSPRAELRVGWLLALTMIVEMVSIGGQALRGATSHFNVSTPFDAFIWNSMAGAIAVMTLVMSWLFWVSVTRSIGEPNGGRSEPSVALALRAGLGLFLLSAVTGFTMGHLLRHSVGGPDGSAGLPLLNWSTSLGDLRVSHFFSVHAIQALPLLALALLGLGLGPRTRTTVLWVGTAAYGALCVGTFVQALAGLPLL